MNMSNIQNDKSEEELFQQWKRFIHDHGFTWKGILSRYDGQGKLTEVLNSTRKFTPSLDQSEIEHYLCFINKDDPSKVFENKWMIEKCKPGIIHPIDPESTIMFSSQSSGIMGRPRRENNVNYAEIYLIQDHRRMSLVVRYQPDDSEIPVLSNISLFRETNQLESSFPWSNQTPEITPRQYPNIKIIKCSILSSDTFEEIPLSSCQLDWPTKDRLIFDFPDGISLNVPKILQPGYEDNLIVSWAHSHNQVKRGIAHFDDDSRAPDLITQDCVIVET